MKLDPSCIFCKIIEGRIPGKKIYEDEWVLCIEDIKPAAPVHYLFLPKKHFKSMVELELDVENQEGVLYLQRIFKAIAVVSNKMGLSKSGFKTTINTGEGGGQTVFHLHVHMLSGGGLKSHIGHV